MQLKELISRQTLEESRVNRICSLINKLPVIDDFTTKNLIQWLNDMGCYGDKGFSSEQGKKLIEVFTKHFNARPYQITKFICNNTFDIWNTNMNQYLDGCFYENSKARSFPCNPYFTTIENVRLWLKENYHGYKSYEGFERNPPKYDLVKASEALLIMHKQGGTLFNTLPRPLVYKIAYEATGAKICKRSEKSVILEKPNENNDLLDKSQVSKRNCTMF